MTKKERKKQLEEFFSKDPGFLTPQEVMDIRFEELKKKFKEENANTFHKNICIYPGISVSLHRI